MPSNPKYSDDSSNPFDTEPPFKSKQPAVRSANINTILISLVLAIAAWNLKETVQQGRDFSRLEERTSMLTRDTSDQRLRIAAVEAQMVTLQLEMARYKAANYPRQ